MQAWYLETQQVCDPCCRILQTDHACLLCDSLFFAEASPVLGPVVKVVDLQAAENGNAEQMLMLSSMLTAGYGCTPDRSKAKLWLDRGKNEMKSSGQQD